MKRLLFVTAASVPVLALALPGQATPPPPQALEKPVEFAVTKEAPRPGKQFTGAVVHIRSENQTTRIDQISCKAAIGGHKIPTRIQKFYGDSSLVGASVSWLVPARARDGASILVECRAAFSFTVGNLGYGSVADVRYAWTVSR